MAPLTNSEAYRAALADMASAQSYAKYATENNLCPESSYETLLRIELEHLWSARIWSGELPPLSPPDREYHVAYEPQGDEPEYMEAT